MTNLSINNIRAHLTEGGARPSLFQVIITNPIVSSGDALAPFMIKSASLPSQNVGQIRVPYMGRTYPIPGDRTFDDWQTTVTNDENFKVRDALEAWNASMNTHRGNVSARGAAPANYMSQATVTQFSKDGSILRTYQFNNIWPASISAIEVDWATVDAIEEFQVTWAYEDWKVIGGRTGDAAGFTGETDTTI